MPNPEQLTFLFTSLDFQGRPTIRVGEIAEKLGMTVRHVINLIESNEMVAINASVNPASRNNWRVPVESYRDFIIRRLSGPCRRDFLKGLPRETLIEVQKQIKELLAA